jgi:hypothetical protein
MAEKHTAEEHAAPPSEHNSSTSSSTRPSRESLSLSRPPSSPLMAANRTSSLAENYRPLPLSPRAHRTPSLSQQAIQGLLDNPPVTKAGDPKFDGRDGRDWRVVEIGEIVEPNQIRFVETTTSVEDATNLLINSGSPNVVLQREDPNSETAVGTFDYSDLNAYLLLVVGLARPEESQKQRFKELSQKGREGKPIPLEDLKDLWTKDPLIFLPQNAPLTKAVEIFGSGIHRVIIVKEKTTTVIGVLTQLRLVEFFWENGRHFTSIEALYPRTLRDLDIGSHSVFAIKSVNL